MLVREQSRPGRTGWSKRTEAETQRHRETEMGAVQTIPEKRSEARVGVCGEMIPKAEPEEFAH